jgi:hypothetical protein
MFRLQVTETGLNAIDVNIIHSIRLRTSVVQEPMLYILKTFLPKKSAKVGVFYQYTFENI